MVSRDTLRAYDASRDAGTDLSVLCHAPFLSLNFDQSGRVTACCFNREYVLGTYPDQSVQEIWQGEQAAALRRAFREGAVVPGCDRCFHQVGSKNFSGALMRNFDVFSRGPAGRAANLEGPPLVLEFELSNTCSLECIMCGGHWSSAIRANREHLPPLRNPYDQAFVEQIERFLPSVRAVRFLGGEPFLITRYHELWESIRRLNPDLDVSITTSGAVVPARPREAVEGLRANFIISLDGITKATYERIRQNAVFEQVMANIADLHDYTRRRGTGMTIACCPMTHNWRELGDIVAFAEARDLGVFFNTVTYPIESSLAGLSASHLASVIDTLEGQGRAASWRPKTQAQWTSLLSQLRAWLSDKEAFVAEASEEARRVTVQLGFTPPAPRPESRAGLLKGLRQRLFGPSQQEPTAQADRWNIAPFLPPLVLARRVELARNEQAAPQTDLLCRLPALPLDLWPAGVKPSPAALLLAVCTVAAMDDPSSSPAAAHIDHLSALISVSLSRPDAAGQMSKIGHWLEQRLATAQWRVAARGAHDLISALQSGGSFAARHPDVRRRLEEGIDALCPADDTRRVLATRLGSVLLSGRGPIDFDADTETQPPDEWLIPSMFPVALEVLAIFQAALRGQVDERLAARIAIVREVMARPDAARALDRVSFLQVHDIMCSADDAAFDAAIQYVRGSVAS